MLPDKEIKAKYKPKFWAEPDKYYATGTLKEEGYARSICKCCKKPFWSMNPDREICGDPACDQDMGFGFIGNTPAKKKLSYIEIWQEFAKMFKSSGYTPIERYPVVARWNPTMEYTNASIAAFQPFVISGEVKPPANPLVIPQFCMRFGDVDNVGITQSHNTGFVMIGQHMFVPPEDWNQNEVFKHIHTWNTKGLGLPNEELTYHEDAWAGGGNLGCCMEFFSRGCELGNQVYMLYEQTPSGVKDLNLKVLDMGMGMERNAWFSQGCATIYDATFPDVMKKMLSATGYKVDEELMKKYTPNAGLLNIDEVDDINKAWNTVSQKVGVETKELKKLILPLSGVYSVAEHTRALLFALNDGALPSNTGGGYNLRILLRRALGFIDKYGWNVDLPTVAKWHADYLKPIFPELSKNLDNVNKILEVEKEKYENTKQKSRHVVAKIIQEDINEAKLVELYDSQGIAPELIAEEAEKLGKEVKVPEDFYMKVAERHEKVSQVHATKKDTELEIKEIPGTKAKYFNDYTHTEFMAKVLKIIDNNMIILDETLFYPTSGGQITDLGTINSSKVVDVFKQGEFIIHKLESKADFNEGDIIEGKVDKERRKQLTQHHTATHVINAAARKILGPHINQAGAKKTTEKAHLDITHYSTLTEKELEEIETESNRIVQEDVPVHKMFLPRDEAERKYGLEIYQGGAVPGQEIRIVEIPEIDVEACGGTHLNSTKEIEKIKIVKATKIQDGIVRLEFTAGKAAEKTESAESGILEESAKLLNCKETQLPSRAEELFTIWKKVVKKKKTLAPEDLLPKSKEEFEGDVLGKLTETLRTQAENIPKTIQRFQREIKEKSEK
jgi:alanyl-tRNA synthetase